jgi:ribose-phosphate pyrophosphokinase
MFKIKKRSVLFVLESCREIGKKIEGAHFGMDSFTEFSDLVEPMPVTQKHFGNNEITAYPNKSVNKKDVIILGSGSNVNGMSINDHLMMLCAAIRSAKSGSAAYITVIMPYLPYCRSDKKDQTRMPIMSQFVCEMIKMAGANRLMSVDLHAGQEQGFFGNGDPFDNMYSIDYLTDAIKKDFAKDLADKKVAVISPDVGGKNRVEAWAECLESVHTFLTKRRDHSKISTISEHKMVHQIDLVGKTVIFVDDMVDTLGTIASAAEIVKKEGAAKVVVVATHGIFSGNAFENLKNPNIDLVYITNSVPQEENLKKSSKLRVVDVSNLICRAILANIKGESLSETYNKK